MTKLWLSTILTISTFSLNCGVQPAEVQQTTETARPGAPDPTMSWGVIYGSCTVSVDCNGIKACKVSCSGNADCQWKVQPGGFVQCRTIDLYDPVNPRTYIYKKTCIQQLAECIPLE